MHVAGVTYYWLAKVKAMQRKRTGAAPSIVCHCIIISIRLITTKFVVDSLAELPVVLPTSCLLIEMVTACAIAASSFLPLTSSADPAIKHRSSRNQSIVVVALIELKFKKKLYIL